MNTPINFELAKLLKEKGFNIEIDYGLNQILNLKASPTIAEVIMWLYEKHGIWITVNLLSEKVLEATQDGFFYEINGKGWDVKDIKYSKEYSSPTEAYEAAIEYTLKNLI